MTVHFTTMSKLLAAHRGRILFLTFPKEAEAKNFFPNIKEREKKMAAKINDLGKQIQEITVVNVQLKEENQQLKSALTEAYDQLAVFFELAEKKGEAQGKEKRKQEVIDRAQQNARQERQQKEIIKQEVENMTKPAPIKKKEEKSIEEMNSVVNFMK